MLVRWGDKKCGKKKAFTGKVLGDRSNTTSSLNLLSLLS